MNWDALGAIGELVGGAAVVASLLFVGIQVRQTGRTVRHAAQDYTNDAAVLFLRSMYERPDVSRMFWNGLNGLEAFDEDERQRFRHLAVAMWLHLEVYFNQWRRGELDADTWEPLRIRILWYHSRQGMREALDVGLPLSGAFTRFLETESVDFDGDAYDTVFHPVS